MSSYDRADWHYGGDFPKDLPKECGGTHIGMFLAWAITRGLDGDLHREDSESELAEVRARRMTGREFLFKCCDERFWAEDLNAEGNAFATDYYRAQYVKDYHTTLGRGLPSTYHVEDNWENFDKLYRVLDRRLEQWRGLKGEGISKWPPL